MPLKKQVESKVKHETKHASRKPAAHNLTPLEQRSSSQLVIPQVQSDSHATASRDVLQYQSTVGNRAVTSLLSVQRDNVAPPAPAPTRTAPRRVNIPIAPKGTIVFRTAKVTLGDIDVYVTGRMALTGKASLIGEELPKKGADAALLARVHSLFQDQLSAAKPAGTAAKIELAIGGETLVLELGDSAARMPAFQVSGHFSAKGRDLAVAGCEVKGAAATMDATAWIAPSKPPPPNPAQPGETPVPGDSSVKRFAFAGSEAQFKDKEGKGPERSGGVTLKTAMDAFEAKLPDLVKQHRFYQLPEQRAAFFQHMRAYFGTDEKTIEHFSKMRKANVKGATTWLHDEAATRLEKVQEEIGEANMPSSGGVGWPRSECTLASKQTVGNLHNIGFAVDYNAYQTPHMKDTKILDLIQIVTGRSATANYGSPAGLDTRSIGETFTSGTDEEKKKLEADPKIQAWLDQIGKEIESVSKASEDFRGSLKTTEKGVEVDQAPKLQELRGKWFAAKTPADKQAVLAELQKVIKPWLDKVAVQKLAMETEIKKAGLEPANLPTGGNLQTAAVATERLAKNMDTLIGKLGTTFKKGQRAQVENMIAAARKLLEETGSKPADDTAALTELRRLAELVKKRQTALKQKKWLDRVNALNAALAGDGSFVFGSSAAKQVSNPAIAQIVDIGFYTLSNKPKAGKEAFNVDFVKSMLKHGFNHGATWSTPDLMHFELRWKGPGQK